MSSTMIVTRGSARPVPEDRGERPARPVDDLRHELGILDHDICAERL